MKKLLLPAFLFIAVSGFCQVKKPVPKVDNSVVANVKAYSTLYVQALQGAQNAHAKYRIDSTNLERCFAKANLRDSAATYHGFIYNDRTTEKNFLASAAFLKGKIDSLNATKR